MAYNKEIHFQLSTSPLQNMPPSSCTPRDVALRLGKTGSAGLRSLSCPNSASKAWFRAFAAMLPPSLLIFLNRFRGRACTAGDCVSANGGRSTFSGIGDDGPRELDTASIFSDIVLPRRRGFIAGTGGVAICPGRGLTGSPTNGTDDVLEINTGSEIIPLVTDFLRTPKGVDRPLAAGCIEITGEGSAELVAEPGPGNPAESPGGSGLMGECENGGRGEGLGTPIGAGPLPNAGDLAMVGVPDRLSSRLLGSSRC